MDEKSQKRLEDIVNRRDGVITEEDKDFLRARRSYLKKAELSEFEDILNQTSKKETVKRNGRRKK